MIPGNAQTDRFSENRKKKINQIMYMDNMKLLGKTP